MNSTSDDRVATPIPEILNASLVAVFLAIGLFQLFGLPALLVHQGVWWALLFVPCVLSTTTNWALIHEGIHRMLLPSPRTNDRCSRALSILFGTQFESVRFAHLMHHRMVGMVADRPEHYVRARSTRPKAALLYYPNLLFGIYAAECVGAFVCLLPRPFLRRLVRRLPRTQEDAHAEAYLLKPGRLWSIRCDAIAVIGLFGLAFWLYGRYWVLLAGSLLARGVLVSVADNAYHYGAPIGVGPHSAYNLRLRGSAAILNFNLHRSHHLHPRVPWTGLPAMFAAEGGIYDQGYLAAVLQQFRGPICDEEFARSTYLPSNLGSRLAKNAETPSRTS